MAELYAKLKKNLGKATEKRATFSQIATLVPLDFKV
jgi:hypothetical protein